MAVDYNSYNEKRLEATLLIPNGLIRNSAFPLENTNLFLSIEDAERYAKGDTTQRDARGFYNRAYAGQIIGVRVGTTGAIGTTGHGYYEAYIIQGDGTIECIHKAIQGVTGATGQQGATGPQGAPGHGFEISSWFLSTEDMYSEYAHFDVGEFVIITPEDPMDPEYGYVYMRIAESPYWMFVVDMSVAGASGIRGPQGVTGASGRDGERGHLLGGL